MVREFRVSVNMDRFVGLQTTPEELQALRGEIKSDNHLLAHLRRGYGCGCGGCQAQAKAAREKLRGAELPMDQSGVPINPFMKGGVA